MSKSLKYTTSHPTHQILQIRVLLGDFFFNSKRDLSLGAVALNVALIPWFKQDWNLRGTNILYLTWSDLKIAT